MIIYEPRTSQYKGLAMLKIEKELRKTETPIERIFYDVVKREMTPEERRILLPPPNKTRKRQ
jgi:hypothetical protein